MSFALDADLCPYSLDAAASRIQKSADKKSTVAGMLKGRPIKLYIFDADGTLRRTTVEGLPCPNKPGDWELMPGVRGRLAEIARAASGGGVHFGVASNQGGVVYFQNSFANGAYVTQNVALPSSTAAGSAPGQDSAHLQASNGNEAPIALQHSVDYNTPMWDVSGGAHLEGTNLSEAAQADYTQYSGAYPAAAS